MARLRSVVEGIGLHFNLLLSDLVSRFLFNPIGPKYG